MNLGNKKRYSERMEKRGNNKQKKNTHTEKGKKIPER